MNKITTIIVDDHPAFRRSLSKFAQTLDVVEIVGQAGNGLQGLELSVELRPQLVLMDICMPKMNGTDSCRAMKSEDASLAVVLYSADPLEIESALSQGVADFCLTKECLFDELPVWVSNAFPKFKTE